MCRNRLIYVLPADLGVTGGYVKTHSHIIVRWSKHHSEARGSNDASVHQFSLNRWASYLITIPLVLIGVVCAVFFFSALVALFLLVGSALGIWLWRVRRRSWTHEESGDLEGTYRVIHEPQIVEHMAPGVGDNNPLRR